MAPSRLVRLTVVKNERDHKRAKHIRTRMGNTIDTVRSHLGDKLCGCGVVAWDLQGKIVTTVVNDAQSPIARAILPRFVRDKLEQHITEDFTREGLEDGA